MEIIYHRRNTIQEIDSTKSCYGIEIDIRSIGENLIVNHEPYRDATLFEDWLQHYHHGTIILNVKEEGLESKVLKYINKKNITNFFFLDQSFPFLVKTALQGERRCAVRVSEYESIETALNIAHLIDWVWIDYFTHFPLDGFSCKRLQGAGLKLCLVSPELQGYYDDKYIANFRYILKKEKIEAEAVCTNRPELWGK